MPEHSKIQSGILLVAVLIAAGLGCAGGDFPFDFAVSDESTVDLPGEDVVDPPDPGRADASLTILSPTELERQMISGPFDFVFSFADDENRSAKITMSGAGTVPVVMEIAGPGEYSMKFVPTPDAQGPQTVRLDADISGGDSASAEAVVVVDTLPPVISFEDPTPQAFQVVADEIPVRVVVTDSGRKVRNVRVTMMDFSRHWSLDDDKATEEFDSANYPALAIPVSGWASGIYTVEVTADDGVPGHLSREIRAFSIFREAEFAADAAGVPQPIIDGIGGAGIRIGMEPDRKWGIVTSRGVFLRAVDGVRTVSPGFDCDGVLWAVFDVNSDGTDDMVGYCRDPGSERVVFMTQDAAGNFVELTVVSGALNLADLAVGDLNGDGYADLAFLEVDDNPLQPVNVALSVTDLDGALTGWGPVAQYIGASDPNNIEIGMYSDNGRNAVLVTSEFLGIFTVFPTDSDGRLLMGENSLFGEYSFVTTAAAGFCQTDGPRDSIVVVEVTSKCSTMYVGWVDRAGSDRIKMFWAAPAGPQPTDIDVADVDGDGTGDIVLLIKGMNTVLFHRGGPDCANFTMADGGMALAGGGASRIWLSDWNNDGYQDLFGLSDTGVFVTYFQPDAGGGHFDGSYQVRLPYKTQDVALGHFVKPLEGPGAAYLDAAVLAGESVFMFASNEFIRQPINLVHTTEPSEWWVPGTGVVSEFARFDVAQLSTGIIPGEFGRMAPEHVQEGYADLDEFVVTTRMPSSSEDLFTSACAMAISADHAKVGIEKVGLSAGSSPTLGVAGGFDVVDGESENTDVAFVWHREKTPEIEPAYFLQSHLGNGDLTFSKVTADATVIEPLYIQENRLPGAIDAFPLRRTLGEQLSGEAAVPDIMVGNKGTSDFTVFLGIGDGRFLAKYDGSLDFAVGLPPLDIAAGYLEGPSNGSSVGEEALGELPDVVTLTRDGNSSVLVVSYALDRQELQNRGLDVGFEVPLAMPIYQPGTIPALNPPPGPVAMDLADFNGDGMTDIVVLDGVRSSVLVYLNRGKRNFSKPVEYFVGNEPVAIKAADVDADGCVDILTADFKGQTLTALRNRQCGPRQR